MRLHDIVSGERPQPWCCSGVVVRRRADGGGGWRGRPGERSAVRQPDRSGGPRNHAAPPACNHPPPPPGPPSRHSHPLSGKHSRQQVLSAVVSRLLVGVRPSVRTGRADRRAWLPLRPAGRAGVQRQVVQGWAGDLPLHSIKSPPSHRSFRQTGGQHRPGGQNIFLFITTTVNLLSFLKV